MDSAIQDCFQATISRSGSGLLPIAKEKHMDICHMLCSDIVKAELSFLR